MEQVILVDHLDREIGRMEKMEAHEKAILHRAFSVFVFNKQGEMLLQKRALSKYHSGGLWTNTCCSHPRPNETTSNAADRRLKEEMGFETKLEKIFDFIYQSPFENGLTEHEFDHVYIGYFDGMVKPNPTEVEAFAFLSLDKIEILVAAETNYFTSWFLIAFPKIKQWWMQQKNICNE